MMRLNGRLLAAAGAGLASAIAIGAGVGWTAGQVHGATGAVNPEPQAQRVGPQSFADLVDKVSPAVVSIDVTEKRPASFTQGDGDDDGDGTPFALPFPFSQFGQGMGGQGRAPRGGQAPEREAPIQEARATGSGFFISPDGYILTNNHVAGDATTIKVRLADGRELTGKLVGHDKATDLAVVKVEGHGFPFVSFEDKAKPRVGDWVVAIGNPMNLGGTVTAGVVSAYNRNIGDQFIDYMQIDAPINRGNSGGPTFDEAGRVVGVNTAMYSSGGGSIGIGFAIPASLAQSVAKQLISVGHVSRGYLGATVQNITRDIALSLGRPDLKGALIADVTPGGPAERGRLQAGDVVIAVNGAPVGDANAMTQRVAETQQGQTIHLEGLRAGRPFAVDVKAGLRPSEDQLAKLDPRMQPQRGGDDDGGE